MKSIILRYGFAILLALSYPVFYFVFSPLTIFSTFFLLDPFFQVTLVGSSILFDSVAFTFIPACTAASAYILLGVLILLTRNIGFRKGLQMFFIGSGAILVMNIVRIISLMWVRLNLGQNYFDAVHVLMWYGVSTLFVFLVWVLLNKWYQIKEVPVYSDIKTVM